MMTIQQYVDGLLYLFPYKGFYSILSYYYVADNLKIYGYSSWDGNAYYILNNTIVMKRSGEPERYYVFL